MAKTDHREADYDVSVAMIGFVVFMMLAIRVLNYPHPRFRKGGWMALSSAMSCYMGVLINMSLYSNLAYFFVEVKTPLQFPNTFTVVLDFTLFLFWWVMKQVSTAWIIGVNVWSQDKNVKLKKSKTTVFWLVIDGFDDDRCAERLESVGTVFGFVCGGASMQAFASLQQMGRGTDYENLVVLGTIPLCTLVLYTVFEVGNRSRMWVASRDSIVSFREAAWGSYMDFAENKVMGLSMSHLMVQAIRFYMTGEYPGVMGQLRDASRATADHAFYLLLCGLGFVCLIASLVKLPFVPGQRRFRMKQWCKMSFSLAVAWCGLYSINWIAAAHFGQHAFTHLCQTTVATVLGTLLMQQLTKLSDFLGREYPRSAAIVQDLFVPVSVLIGFSWRDAWNGAMTNVSNHVNIGVPAPMITLFDACWILGLVYPAWRRYILPKMFIEWVPNPSHESTRSAMIDDCLVSKFALPVWLQQDLYAKRKKWMANTDPELEESWLKDMRQKSREKSRESKEAGEKILPKGVTQFFGFVSSYSLTPSGFQGSNSVASDRGERFVKSATKASSDKSVTWGRDSIRESSDPDRESEDCITPRTEDSFEDSQDVRKSIGATSQVPSTCDLLDVAEIIDEGSAESTPCNKAMSTEVVACSSQKERLSSEDCSSQTTTVGTPCLREGTLSTLEDIKSPLPNVGETVSIDVYDVMRQSQQDMARLNARLQMCQSKFERIQETSKSREH